jgi:hypothetical protein
MKEKMTRTAAASDSMNLYLYKNILEAAMSEKIFLMTNLDNNNNKFL